MVCSEIGISCIQLWASSQTLFCVICFEHFVYIPVWQFFTPSKLGVHLSRTYVFSCLDELSSEMSYYISSQFLFGHTSLVPLSYGLHIVFPLEACDKPLGSQKVYPVPNDTNPMQLPLLLKARLRM